MAKWFFFLTLLDVSLLLLLCKGSLISEGILTFVSFIPFFIFGFWPHLATKLRKYYVIFVYILQGKIDKTKKITQWKWPNYPKPKDENMGWMKHLAPLPKKVVKSLTWAENLTPGPCFFLGLAKIHSTEEKHCTFYWQWDQS